MVCPVASGGSTGVGGESSKSGTGGSAGTTGTQSQLGGSTGATETTSSAGTTSAGGSTQTSSGGTGTAGSSFGLGGATTTSTTSAGTGGVSTGGNSGVGTSGGTTSGGTTSGGTTSGGTTSGGTTSGGTTSGGTSGTVVVTLGGTTSGGTSSTTGGTTAITCDGANAVTVTSTSLTGCLGEVYAAPLTATGGSPADIDWTVDFPTGLGLSAVKTNSGDTELQGNLASSGNFTLYASARNSKTGCVSARVGVSLAVGGGSTTFCPSILANGQAVEYPLIAPACRGLDYSATFQVANGTAPYTWTAVTLPPGLTFNSTNQQVTGTPTDAGAVVVQVTDSGSPKRIIRRSFSMPMRDKCWLAYILPGTTTSSLHLVDPLLGHVVQPAASQATGVSAQDFKFSPDGRHLAYRLKNGNGNSRLVISEAPTWTSEMPIELGADSSVISYSWASNSATLAIAFSTAAGQKLTGVGVGTSPLSLTMLTPLTVDLEVTSPDLVWYGNDGYVVFSTLNPFDPDVVTVCPSHARLASTGFLDLVTVRGNLYEVPMALYPSANGFYSVDGGAAYADFYPFDSKGFVAHGSDAIAPSGAYTAFASAGTLSVYRQSDKSYFHTETPWLSSPGCSALLAWSPSQEEILCADQLAALPTLKVFQVNPLVPSLQPAVVGNSTAFVQSNWSGYARLMSPSGRRFAMTSTNFIVAGLANTSAPMLQIASGLSPTAQPASLAFSPDEQLLAFQSGNGVFILDMTGTANARQELGSVASSAVSCQEDSPQLPTWCGRARETPGYQWSPDSQMLAIARADGNLVVWDGRLWPKTSNMVSYLTVASGCIGPCIGGFKFQP